MATRLVLMIIDSADTSRQAAFWAAALGWEVAQDDLDHAVVWPPGFNFPGPDAVPLVFLSVPEPKTVKNRIHLDLATESATHQAELVRRLGELGAVPVDLGQGEVPWVVLADPEGNEFCVLEPRPEYRDTGPVAAIVVDTAVPAGLGDFWIAASGWCLQHDRNEVVSLRSPSDVGPYLEFVPNTDPKRTKNRVHLDVAPPLGQDHTVAVEALLRAGAVRANIGQGDVSWAVLADPEANEFCVLSPC